MTVQRAEPPGDATGQKRRRQTYTRRVGIVPLTETLRWKLTEDAMVMSAAKAHWKPMKLADEGKWSTADVLLSIHTFKRAKRIWFVLRQARHQLVI